MTTPTEVRVSDERLRQFARRHVRHEGDRSNVTLPAEELQAVADELLATRQALREATSALDYVIKDNDGWIECGEKSLVDPEFGSALSNYEQFISEERAEIALRKRHAATLRQLSSLACEKADKSIDATEPPRT